MYFFFALFKKTLEIIKIFYILCNGKTSNNCKYEIDVVRSFKESFQ